MPAQGRNCLYPFCFQHFPLILFFNFLKEKQMKRIFFIGYMMIAASAFAQKDSTTATDSFLLLAPVEIRATRLNDKAPFAVTNFSSKKIEEQNLGQSFPYLLSQTPSVITSSDDGNGVGYASLRIRGSDITRINVTFNGVPVNDPESGSVFFVNFGDLASSTHSVQIQRGVGSSTNGPGAFGASINIFNVAQKEEATASISNSFGSFNTWKHTLQAATGMLKGGFQFDVRLSKLSSDGFIDRAFSDLKSLHFISGWTSKNEMTNIKFNLLTGKERTGQAWNGIGTYFSTADAVVNYEKQLYETGRTTNTLGKISDNKYYSDQTDNYQQDYYQLFFNHKFNTNWTANVTGYYTKGRGYYNEYKDGESFSDYGIPNITIGGTTISSTNLTRQLWLNNRYYGSVFSANYNKKHTDLIFGGAITQYDAKHYGFVTWAEQGGFPVDYKWYNLTADKNDFNFFGKAQWEFINNLYGFVDLQYRHITYNIYGFRKNPEVKSLNDYSFFNPKVGISYIIKHLHNAQSKIFASFAVANKEPNRDDFEASPADKPQPEKLQDVEAGYQYNSEKFVAGINGYYMNYKNQLVLTGKINDVGAYTRTNVDRSYRAGVELTTTIHFTNWFTVDANATFSRNKIKSIDQFYDVYDNDNDWNWLRQDSKTYTNTDIAFSPNIIAGGTATFNPFYGKMKHSHFYIDLVQKYASRQYLDNSQDKLKSINPFSLTDFRLRYDINLRSTKTIGLLFMANNIFNKKFENNGYTYSYYFDADKTLATENYYFPQAGVNFNFGTIIRL
jgi:iron complex outermembrane receptor protein